MKNLLLAALAGATAMFLAPAANAAETIVITGPSGTFGDDSVMCAPGGTTGPCEFTNTFSFVTPDGFNLSSATISSTIAGTNGLTNIDFNSVTLNGTSFNLVAKGDTEFRDLLNQAIIPGATNTLVVNGTSGGEGSFSGTLSFAAVSAVPEPSTWAFMLVGFGAVGYSMRKRPSGKTTYRFVQAV